jgi:hypothetical protein
MMLSPSKHAGKIIAIKDWDFVFAQAVLGMGLIGSSIFINRTRANHLTICFFLLQNCFSNTFHFKWKLI